MTVHAGASARAARCGRAGLEEALAGARAERERLGRALEAARLRRDLARELLGSGDDASLSAVPVVASVVALLASFAAAVCAYVAALGGGSASVLGGMVAVLLSLLAGLGARGHGAGGEARTLLRKVAFGIALLAAVFLMLAAGATAYC